MKELKELRARNNWTQRFTAEQFGVSVKTIESWEQGRTSMSKPGRIILEVLINRGVPKLNDEKMIEILNKLPAIRTDQITLLDNEPIIYVNKKRIRL